MSEIIVLRHNLCPKYCHKCPDLSGDIMPGCMGGAVYNDLDRCTCDRPTGKSRKTKPIGEGEAMREGENARAERLKCGCLPSDPNCSQLGAVPPLEPNLQRAYEFDAFKRDLEELYLDGQRFRWLVAHCTRAAKMIDDQPPMINDFENWFRARIDEALNEK